MIKSRLSQGSAQCCTVRSERSLRRGCEGPVCACVCGIGGTLLTGSGIRTVAFSESSNRSPDSFCSVRSCRIKARLRLVAESFDCAIPGGAATASRTADTVLRVTVRRVLHRIVRCFLSDGDVMRMVFLNRRCGDFDESSGCPQVLNGGHSHIAHP